MAKKKRRRIKRVDSISPDAVPVREYYHAAFREFRIEMRRRKLYASTYSSKRHSYWQVVPPGHYGLSQGQELVQGYLASVSRLLRTKISNNSLSYWLHLYRRIAPGAIGRDKHPLTVTWTRATFEAAAQKWAPVALCDRIAPSNSVDEHAILRGYLVNNDRPMLEAIRARPQLVLTDFGLAELVDLFEMEKLAYEIWYAMALLRVLGKGAELVVDHCHSEIVYDNRDDELDSLLQSYDSRYSSFIATATGTIFTKPATEPTQGTMLFPIYNVANVTYDQLRPVFELAFNAPFLPPIGGACPNFVLAPFDLCAFYQAHKPFGTAFKLKHGLTLESVICLIAGLACIVARSWATQPHHLWRHFQRGYDGANAINDIVDAVTACLPEVVRRLELKVEICDIDIAAAVRFLTLSDEVRELIDVSYAGPHSVFLPTIDSKVFVDYAYLSTRLYHSFFDLHVSDQNFKGDALEIVTQSEVSTLPIAALKSFDGTRRQIDAAFAQGEILVIAECRAVGRSIAFDRGDTVAIKKRIAVVDKALQDADEKAQWLAKRPVGTNYDVREYRGILPVGVTPFVEFIPSRAARYWIDESTPRVLSPPELRRALLDGRFKAALWSPNVVSIN